MKRLLSANRSFWAALAVAAMQANSVFACSVCFGNTDSQLGRGLNWGVFTLLAIVFVVLGIFGAFFYYIAKRSALYEARQAAMASGRPGSSQSPIQE